MQIITSAPPDSRKRRPARSGRLCVGASSRYGQLNFSTGIEFAPDFEITSHKFGAFAHAAQTPMPKRMLVGVKNARINALAVVADSESQALIVVSDLHFDAPSPGVPDCITQRLCRHPESLVANNRIKFSRRSFHLSRKLGETVTCRLVEKFPAKVV